MSRHPHHRNPWWWTFTDVELSMIASHLAAGGSFCCMANADARELVTRSLYKQALLAEHAYEAWGCYGDNKGERGSGSRAFAGHGPYGWITPGLEHTEADTANKRESELRRAAKYFQDFLADIAPRPPLTLERYHQLKRNADAHFAILDDLTKIVDPVTVN